MVMEPPGDGDRDKVKKRPLSVSSLSSLSSTSPQRVQHKRPNLSEDGEESCSDLPSHTSSDSNLTGPASDRLSLTSDRESLTSDPVSLTSDGESLTSDSVCMTSDRVSMPSVADSGVTTTTVPLKRVASASDERRADTAEDVDGETCLTPAMADRSVVPLDALCGGQLELPGPSRESSGVSAGGRSSGGSPSTSPSLQPNWLAMAAVGAHVGHHRSSLRTTTPSSPSLGRSAATDTSVPQTTPSPRPSPADSANDDTSSQQTPPPATSLRVSCVGAVTGGQPLVMKPLQTTIRPVPITIPDSIRKPHCSSNSVKDEVSAEGVACGRQVSAEGVACGRQVNAEGVAYGRQVSAEGVACGRQVSAEGVACGRQVSAEGGLRSRQSSESSGTLTPPSPLRGGSVAASPASAAAVGPVKSVLSTLEAATAGSRQDFAGSRTAGARSSVLTADSVSSVAGRTGRGVHVSRVTVTAPPAPGQVPKGSPLSCSSPLSPTAMARRRFLASHFDIPDVSPQEPPQDCSAQDWSAERPAASADSSAVSVSSGRSCSLAVPSSLPFLSNTDTSPVTSRSDSPGSAVQSPSGDSLHGTEASATRSSQPTPSPPSPPQSLAAEQSASTPTAAPTATPTAVPTAVPTATPTAVPTAAPSRNRSQRKAEGGGVSGRGGSVKAGTYVTYAQRVVTELVDTERLYVNSLEAIITGYKQRLESLLSGRDGGRQDLACLFCNITDIFSFSKVFLCDLEQCGVDPVKVAECFVRHNTGFVIYTDYCTNYPRAVEVLTRFMQDAELSEVCKACQVSLGHGLPLGAYLLRPVQRILKYHLLLQNILKNFDKSRAGYDLLEKALGHMTDMAHHINEMKRRHEHAVRIQEVQSQLEDYAGEDLTRLGELVLEGSFRVYGAKASRQVFLFEKGILISKKKEAGMLTCKAFVPCSNLMLVEVIPSEPLSFHIIPFDNPRAQHTLQARSMEQKRHWCQEIKRLILESYKGRIPDNVKSLVMELGRNHDNDYVGKDAHDSPWKHQHTAPEYLEKRRFRRKSGGKVPDIVPLLKFPRGAVKRDPATGNKSKSPKVWRKSDSPVSSGNRERAESVPMMLSTASSSSLPVLGVSSSLSCQSLRPDTATTAHQPPDTTAHQPPDTTAHQPPPQPIADGNNNHDKSPAAFPGSSAVAATCPGTEAEGTRAESVRKRAASFKRAVRYKPLSSHDLSDGLPDEDAAPDDDPSRRKPDEEPGAGSQRLHASNTQRQQRRQSRDDDDNTASSPSGDDDSSDADRGQRPHRKRRGGGRGGVPAAMYGSMPALNSLERRPAQKRRPGETKSGLRRKADVWKSSDGVAGPEDRAGTARPYRRRWEAEGAALQQQQRKVPALHDAYGRRCREALVRKRGLGASCGATLTDWGSVDKLTHGSLADLSHLKEDPWVKKDPPNQPLPSPGSRDAPAALTPTPVLGVHTRSHSASLLPSKDWNPQDAVPGPGRPRNNSDVTEVMRRSWKENLDWMVYVNRNSGDQDIRERADSLSKPSGRSRAASGDSAVKALSDSNSSISVRDSNISRSVSLCQDTLKRYSLEMPDRKKLPGDGEVSPKGLTSEDVLTTSADKPDTPSSPCATLTSVDADVEMTDVVQPSGKGGAISPTAGSRTTPRPRSNVHQLLSPTPFSPPPLSAAPFFPTPFSPALRGKARVTPTSRSQPPQGPPSTQRASSQGGQSPLPISSQSPPLPSQPPPLPTDPPPTAADPPPTPPPTPPTPADPPPLPSQPPPTLSQPPSLPSQPPPTLSQPPPTLSQPPPCSLSWAQRTVSAQTATLSAEGERLVAEMERYYEAHSPGTPTLTFRFPPSQDSWRDHSPQPADGGDDSPALHHETNASINHPNANRDNTASTDRLSGVSSVSSSNDSSAGHFHPHLLHPWRDVNPNRLSGTSSVSTSSFDSQNSSSSESVVGALKNKLSAWTLKLGGRRNREEDASDPRDSLTSPASLLGQADLQHVLREHSLGSPHIGLRMANTLPVGFEPLLSPPAGTRDRASSGKLSGKEGSGQPHGRFSFPSAVPERSKAAEALGASRPVQQSDSGISVHSAQSGSAGVFSHGANALPDDPSGPQHRGDGEDVTQRRDSASSSSSGDSFYERRLSVAFESGLFQEDALGQQQAGPQSPEGRQGPRRSIREVVQYIEEKFRPRQPTPVEVRRKEPSALIRQRLQSLRDNASYRCRPASRSHSEDRGRERDSTPDSPRLARPQQRSRSANQFMHRVQLEAVVCRDSREGEQATERERESAAKTERETALGRERETAWRVPELGWEKEEKMEGGGSSGVNAMGSMDRLDQQSSEVDNLVIMRGWVRNLINKFQQIT